MSEGPDGSEAFGLWVIFNEKGEASFFGPRKVEGAEWVPGLTSEVAIERRRVFKMLPLPRYYWVPRDPPPPPPPVDETEANLALLVEKAKAEEERQERIELELARLAGPDVLLRACGKITIAELNLRVEAIRAKLEQEM